MTSQGGVCTQYVHTPPCDVIRGRFSKHLVTDNQTHTWWHVMGPLTKPSITNYKTYNLDYKYYGIIQSIRPCTNHYVKPLKTSKNDPKIDLYKRDVCAVKYLDGPDEGHGHPLLELVDRGV